ncbi:hypothetical protein M9H77_12742 [Catharanthus roseus]|uniref:Uncharacterized protein n=1 Tax=Catharanthus roseus TaxID=4058 RepID=A0ACC0BIE0_CATRO|nr:hypothetical protein M9H77_12742 [Catharanthus roseus]
MAALISLSLSTIPGYICPLTRALHFDSLACPKFKRKSTLYRSIRLFSVSIRAASTMSYEKELAAAKKACSLAARLCQKVQKALLQSDVQSKSDRSPVTVADYGSQALVSFILKKELPSMAFSLVAEEDSEDLRKDQAQETLDRITKLVNETLASEGVSPLSDEDVLAAIDAGKSEGGSLGQHWVLDPIDGTKGFLRGDQYAIALALLDKGKVVLGVLACPNLPLQSLSGHDESTVQNKVGCLFYAQVGSGTYMQCFDGSPLVKVHVNPTENPEEASFFESYEKAHSMQDLTSLIAKKMGVKAPPVRIDSQAKYGALARGDGAIYMRFPHKGYREKIWDHAAGYIVVTENARDKDMLLILEERLRLLFPDVFKTHVNLEKKVLKKYVSHLIVGVNDSSEAGGVTTDAAGSPLDFSRGRYLDLDTGIIVTNQKLMPALLKAVQESLKEKASCL